MWKLSGRRTRPRSPGHLAARQAERACASFASEAAAGSHRSSRVLCWPWKQPFSESISVKRRVLSAVCYNAEVVSKFWHYVAFRRRIHYYIVYTVPCVPCELSTFSQLNEVEFDDWVILYFKVCLVSLTPYWPGAEVDASRWGLQGFG